MLTLFKKVWGIYKPLHGVMVGVFCLLILSIGLNFVWPYMYGKTIDTVIRGGGLHAVLVLLLIAFAIMFFQNIVSWLQGWIEVNHFDYDSLTHVQNLTFAHLLTLSIGQHRNEHSGLTQSVISDGQNAVTNLINVIVYQFLPYVLQIGIGLVVLFIFSWQLGIIALVGSAVILTVTFITNAYFVPLVREERDMNQEIGKKRSEVLRNAPLVIANAGEKYTEEALEKENERNNTFGKRLWSKYIYMSYLMRPILSDFTLVGSIACAAYLVATGDLTAGAVVTAVLWTNTVLGNLANFGNIQRQILYHGERARKYFSLLDLVSDVPVLKTSTRLESTKSSIKFENVSFVYPKNRIIEDDRKKKSLLQEDKPSREALMNISFEIKAGEHVAFVGSSGAGKSTVVLLLLRGSDPQTGRILINGVDLREIDLTSYRQHLGVVEQHIVLFDDTIRKNISFGLPDGKLLSDEELDRLSKITRLDEFKDKLVDGWDTMIGENGIKLSGGQRQRVGIARALAKNPSILILDEATSSLDAKNEALIKEALHEASEGRTTIMVAHRLSTIKDADRIFVFDKGTIVGVGKHEELLQTCPIYADLVSHQTVLL